MKKKLVLLLAGVMAVSVLASGCGENETTGTSASGEAEPEVYTAEMMLASTEYDVEDYVKLANYKKISVEVDQSYEVTDEAKAEYANSIMSYYPDYVEVDEAIEEGHIANISYVGTIDGEEFDGGSYDGYDLTIGSGAFIDGFEDGLIGYKTGDVAVLDLQFPEDYSMEDVAGKDVTFTVTINSVKEATTITYDEIYDDYVATNFYSAYGITTVDGFNEVIESNLQSSLDVAIQDAFLTKLVEESEVTLPDGLLDERVQMTLDAYEEEVTYYDMTLEEYLEMYYEQTLEEFTTELRTSTEEALIEELVLEALVAELDCEVVAEEFNAFVEYFASYYYMTEDEFIEACGGKDYLILNYAEYYVALELACEEVDYTFVEVAETTEDTEADTTEETTAE